jgi:type IV secretory pathway VirB4 component
MPEKNGKSSKKHNEDIFATFANGNEQLLQALRGFEEMRKKNKHALTDYAKELLLKKLEQMSSLSDEQIAILNQSIERGWQGIFPLDSKQKQRSSNPALDRLKEMGVAGNESG